MNSSQPGQGNGVDIEGGVGGYATGVETEGLAAVGEIMGAPKNKIAHWRAVGNP